MTVRRPRAAHDTSTYEPDRSRFDAAPIHASRVAQRWVATTCGYCSVGCGMLLGVRDERIVAVQGDPAHPVNLGRLCPKGLSEHHTVSAKGRLTHPTLRGQRVDWDSAVDALVTSIESITAQHGPDAFAIISTGQLVTEEFYALGKLARLGLGLTNYDGNTTLCMASAVSGYKRTFGTDGPPGCYEDLESADVIVLVGANVADNHPLLAPRLLANREATIFAIDPRATKTATLATHHLAIAPRTDLALFNGVIRLLLDKDLVDHAAIAQHTNGIEALRATVAPYTADEVARICGISVPAFEELALAMGTASALTTAWTMGVNHSEQGTDTVAAINTIHLLTGQIGRPGASPLSITGQCNAMGTREAGFTASMPGYRSFDNPAHREQLASLWGISPDRLPTARGRSYPEILDGIEDGTIRGLWVIGTNPVVSFPNRTRTEELLDRLDFLAVQDGFATPTTDRATLVLPAAIWGEKAGSYTNSERRVSAVRAAVPPPGVAKSDFAIFLAIAERVGCRDDLFAGWSEPSDAFAEWRAVSKDRPCDYSLLPDDVLLESGGAQWPNAARLYTDGRYNTADGRAQLSTSAWEPPHEPPSAEFPFVLNTGRTVEHWHTRTKTGAVAILDHLVDSAWVEVHPHDAECLGLDDTARVRVTSRRGEIRGVRVRVTATVRIGEVFLPFHFAEQCANDLCLDVFDPVSFEPNYKQCAVALTREERTQKSPVWSVRRHRTAARHRAETDV
jgi:anaerobic selenocysteine-containing dehydrogenase